jgi:hypothetical protein
VSRSAPAPQDDCDGRRDVSGGRGGRREFSLDEAGEPAAIVHTGDDRDNAAAQTPADASPQAWAGMG